MNKCSYCQSTEPCYDGFTLGGYPCQHPDVKQQYIPEGHHVVEDADGSRFVKNDQPQIMEPIQAANGSQAPATVEEARAFHNGFIAGLTSYATAIGHSGLKAQNKTLLDLMAKQGWKTIEIFEHIGMQE